MKPVICLLALLLAGCTVASRRSDDMMRAEYAAFKTQSDREMARLEKQAAEIRHMIRTDPALR